MNTRKKIPLRYSNSAAPVPIAPATKAPSPTVGTVTATKKPRSNCKGTAVASSRYDKEPPTSKSTSTSTNRKSRSKQAEEEEEEEVGVDVEWERNYQMLAKYKAKHGSCKITLNGGGNRKLTEWTLIQRLERDTLTESQCAKLDAIDFPWRCPIPDQFRFEWMYAKLKRYHAQYGDCLVPIRWQKDPKFGRWVSRQRETQNTLPKDRKARLDALGFVWRVKDYHRRKLKEEQRHEPVCGTRNKKKKSEARHVHVVVPALPYDEKQRAIDEAISSYEWSQQLEQVANHARLHGDDGLAGVPQRQREWISQQLVADLTLEQKQQLREVLLMFSDTKTRPLGPVVATPSPVATKATATATVELQPKQSSLWDRRFQQVKAFHETGVQAPPYLTAWLSQQMVLLQQGHLLPHEKLLLRTMLQKNDTVVAPPVQLPAHDIMHPKDDDMLQPRPKAAAAAIVSPSTSMGAATTSTKETHGSSSFWPTKSHSVDSASIPTSLSTTTTTEATNQSANVLVARSAAADTQQVDVTSPGTFGRSPTKTGTYQTSRSCPNPTVPVSVLPSTPKRTNCKPVMEMTLSEGVPRFNADADSDADAITTTNSQASNPKVRRSSSRSNQGLASGTINKYRRNSAADRHGIDPQKTPVLNSSGAGSSCGAGGNDVRKQLIETNFKPRHPKRRSGNKKDLVKATTIGRQSGGAATKTTRSARATRKRQHCPYYGNEEARSFIAACSRKIQQQLLHRATKRKRLLY